MNTPTYTLLPHLFLRAPFYSYRGFDPERLPEVLGDRHFRDAIWLASPAFWSILERKGFDYARLSDRERFSLYKYYNRMCFRAVPFGAFSSFSVTCWADGRAVRLSDAGDTILHLQPDQELLARREALQVKSLEKLKLAPNPARYRFDEVIRFYTSTLNERGRLIFGIGEVAAEPLTEALLQRLAKSPRSFRAVAGWVMRKTGCTEGEAEDFVRFLLDSQIIFQDTRAQVIEPPVLSPPISAAAKRIFDGRKLCENYTVDLLAAQLESLQPEFRASTGKCCFYAALERPAFDGGPGKADAEELMGAFDALMRLSTAGVPGDLQQFIRDFSARFDQQSVPILAALDPDAGLPYGSLAGEGAAGVLKAVAFPAAAPAPPQLPWTPARKLLFERWTGARAADPYGPVLLSSGDLAGLPLPARTAAAPVQSLFFRKAGDRIIIDNTGGPSACALVGRFSLFSAAAHALCRTLVKAETQPNEGVIFAEIGQLAAPHTDNINRRKQLYSHRIPINVFDHLENPAVLPPDDLQLRVSGGELILESVKLGKRVIPRLPTAFNYRHCGLALFRLLCDLQFQGVHFAQVPDLEALFPGMPFYPRLCYEQTVLSPAKWKLSGTQFAALTGNPTCSLQKALQEFRAAHRLPSVVCLGEFDQQLVFNLEDPEEAGMFIMALKGQDAVTLREYFDPGRWVKAGNKPFAGQFAAFFHHDATVFRAIPANRYASNYPVIRSFMPGSEWLYLKLYCTPVSSATLLDMAATFAGDHTEEIITWFFIRYEEGGYHLRLRFQLRKNDCGPLLAAFHQRLQATGLRKLVKKCQADTYEREIERYGGSLISQVEAVFCAGSRLAACSGESAPAVADEESPGFWPGIYITSKMIRIFIKDIRGQVDFAAQRSGEFIAENGGSGQLQRQLDLRYRALRGQIEKLFHEPADKLPAAFRELATSFFEEVSALADQVSTDDAPGRTALLADLIHMQLNRFFIVKPRRHELFVYYCLHKLLQSKAARKV